MRFNGIQKNNEANNEGVLSTDITSQPQLLIFGRFLKESSVIEELLTCISLETTTKGEDIFNAVDKFFTENNLDWSKVIVCTMNGAPSVMGKDT